jgi:hypothetical protein
MQYLKYTYGTPTRDLCLDTIDPAGVSMSQVVYQTLNAARAQDTRSRMVKLSDLKLYRWRMTFPGYLRLVIRPSRIPC